MGELAIHLAFANFFFPKQKEEMLLFLKTKNVFFFFLSFFFLMESARNFGNFFKACSPYFFSL